jgi:homocitrate synthase
VPLHIKYILFCDPPLIIQAGIHAKAILANPSTYEILDPADFGQTRYVHIGSRLTGWNAVKSRSDQLKLGLSDDQVKAITGKIKKLADIRTLSIVRFFRDTNTG